MSERDLDYIVEAANSKKIYYYARYATLKNDLINVEQLLDKKNAGILNGHKRNKSVCQINIDGNQYVVEHTNVEKLEKKIKNFIRDPAKIFWENANLLMQNGIPIVEPVALIQQYSLFLPKNEFLISQHYDGINGEEYFAPDSPTRPHWEGAINGIFKLLQQLKIAKITHDYFRCSNIMMVNHQPLLMGVQHVNQFEGEEKAYNIEHGFDIDFFSRYLRFSPDAQKLFEIRRRFF